MFTCYLKLRIAELRENPLNNLNNPDLVTTTIRLQNKIDSYDHYLADEIRRVKKTFDLLKLDIHVTKMLIFVRTYCLNV